MCYLKCQEFFHKACLPKEKRNQNLVFEDCPACLFIKKQVPDVYYGEKQNAEELRLLKDIYREIKPYLEDISLQFFKGWVRRLDIVKEKLIKMQQGKFSQNSLHSLVLVYIRIPFQDEDIETMIAQLSIV